jgi:uncharacterized protein (DUF2062 family)
MTKGYPDKIVAQAAADEKPEEKKVVGTLAAVSAGMAVGLAVAFACEALLIWVILAYLMKVKFAYLQVLGAVILGEYLLGRITLKKDER